MNEDYDDFIQKTNYTFIPEDPRAYYRRLIESCLKAPNNDVEEEEAGESLLSNSKMALLTECAMRWRVHPGARVALLLDVVRQLYDSEELSIHDLSEAFSIADFWNYPSWPIADVTLF